MKIAIVIFLIVCVVITILDYLIIVGGNMNKSDINLDLTKNEIDQISLK